MREARGSTASNIQHGFWQCNGVGPSCRSEWISLSAEVNLCLLGKRIASYKFCLGRTCISITIKLINENEVVNGGVTIILFLVCVPKIRKGICPFLFFFETLKNEMAWKHIGTLELKLKRNVALVPSEMVRSLAQEEGVIHIILTCSASPLFLTIPSRVLLLPVSNRTCWKKIFFVENLLDLDRENRTDFMKPCAMARIRSQSNFR